MFGGEAFRGIGVVLVAGVVAIAVAAVGILAGVGWLVYKAVVWAFSL